MRVPFAGYHAPLYTRAALNTNPAPGRTFTTACLSVGYRASGDSRSLPLKKGLNFWAK